MRWFAASAFWMLTATALAETPALPEAMAGRCWATHVLQGDLVRSGTRSAAIATENATFWRSQASVVFQNEEEREAYLSAALAEARAEQAPAMAIVMRASTCQTLRADIEPGYDPVRQNTGN